MFKPGYLPTLAMLVATLTTVNAHAQTAASEDHSAHHGATSEQAQIRRLPRLRQTLTPGIALRKAMRPRPWTTAI